MANWVDISVTKWDDKAVKDETKNMCSDARKKAVKTDGKAIEIASVTVPEYVSKLQTACGHGEHNTYDVMNKAISKLKSYYNGKLVDLDGIYIEIV